MNYKFFSLFLLILSFVLFSATAKADSPWGLDTSFGADGFVATDYKHQNNVAVSTIIDSKGNFIVAGYTDKGDLDFDLLLTRYNSDGVLDTTFGTKGFVVTDIGSKYDSIDAVTLDADGKILVTGYTTQGDLDIFVARYEATGVLDKSFGNEGIVITDLPADNSYEGANDVIVDKEGRILVCGYTFDADRYVLAVLRYDSTGTLDPSFDGDGIFTLDIGTIDDATNLKLDSDGNIIVSGLSFNGKDYDLVVLRLKDDGTLDDTFGDGGKVITDFGTGEETYALLIDSSNNIILGGESYAKGAKSDFLLVRYKSSGKLDSEFGSKGKVVKDLGADEMIWDAVLDQDGKIVAVGTSDSLKGIALARFNKDGSLDTTFSKTGAITDLDFSNKASATAIDKNGEIVIVGYTDQFFGTSDSTDTSHNFLLARYHPTVCGDGRTEGAETCDDANFKDGDGCTKECVAEKSASTGDADENAAEDGLGACGCNIKARFAPAQLKSSLVLSLLIGVFIVIKRYSVQ